MKAFLIAMSVVCLAVPAVFQAASAQAPAQNSAQDIDAQCSKMRDKVACVCALQNGGRLTRVGGYKKQGWWLRRRESRQPSDAPDSEKITFPAKFKLKHWKLRPSPAVEGYLACMHQHGRK